MSIKNFLKILLLKVERLKNMNKYGSYGQNVSIMKPLRIMGGGNIYIDDNVSIHSYCWLAAVPLTDEGVKDKCRLTIKNGSVIGDFAHIFATHEITIEEDVLLANFVYISDNAHGYEDVDVPIIKQPIVQKSSVKIGKGSWIGEHVSIFGASIGTHCIIGSNSVVNHDIPDYSIAVGAPAKVIKQYNFKTKKWERILNA